MARIAGASAEETRARVLSAAAQLFAEAGRDGVTTREVAKRAGTTAATLHHYFGDKESLYRAAVEAVYAELGTLRDVLQAKMLSGGLGDRPLETVVRLGFQFACAHPTAMRLTLRQVVATGELPHQGRLVLQGPFLDQASQLFASMTGRKQDEVRIGIQSLIALCGRYAISNDDELATLVPSQSDRASRLLAIENHLVRVAEALLGPVALSH